VGDEVKYAKKRAMILQGATSSLGAPVDVDYFESLRARVRTSRE
jgi:antitoxin ParD1/3/4